MHIQLRPTELAFCPIIHLLNHIFTGFNPFIACARGFKRAPKKPKGPRTEKRPPESDKVKTMDHHDALSAKGHHIDSYTFKYVYTCDIEDVGFRVKV